MSTSKYVRGQVWYINDQGNAIGSEQMKSRPWVIVSNNKANKHSPVLHLAPITTREYDGYPMHVFYKNADGRPQIIECEQITCMSVKRLERNGNYLYILDPDIMVKVDEAIAIQFGITNNYQTEVTKFEDRIDRAFKSIFSEFDGKISTSKFIEFITKFNMSYDAQVELMKRNSSKNPIPATTQIEVTTKTDHAPRNNPVYDNSITSTHQTPPKPQSRNTPTPSKRSRNKWSDEMKRQYVEDSKTLSLRELAEKYNLGSSATAAQYKYKFLSNV